MPPVVSYRLYFEVKDAVLVAGVVSRMFKPEMELNTSAMASLFAPNEGRRYGA